jgi:hypothetical protein
VAPLEHVVRPEGHVGKRNKKRQVAPLEHLVHPEGNITLLFNNWINLDGFRTNNVLRKI